MMPAKHATADEFNAARKPQIGIVFSNRKNRPKSTTYPQQSKALTTKLALFFQIAKSPQPPYPSTPKFAIIVNYPDSDVLKGI